MAQVHRKVSVTWWKKIKIRTAPSTNCDRNGYLFLITLLRSASHNDFRTHANHKRHSLCVLDIPETTVINLLRSVFCMFSYRYQRVHMLQLGDPQLCIDFANEFLIQYDADYDWPLRILWTEEVHFRVKRFYKAIKREIVNIPHTMLRSALLSTISCV